MDGTIASLVAAVAAHAPSLSAMAGLLMAFALHATLLLAFVWALERAGALKHPGWAEFAWRLALFGAFVSAGLQALPMSAIDAPSEARIAAVPAIVPATVPVIAPAGAPAVASVPPGPVRTAPATALQAANAMPTAPAAMANDAPPLRTPAVIALPLATDAIALALLAWALGTAWFALRLLRQWRALRRLRRRAQRDGLVASPALQAALRDLAVELRLSAPELRLLPLLDSPVALPGAILLPRWAEGLDAAQQRAMLAHELAHLQRRDPRWRLLQRLALAPLFFHPLAWLARRRLETLAETLCDRTAAGRGGARALAECLAECLARTAPPQARALPAAGLALAMAEHHGGIVERVRALLERRDDTASAPTARRRWLVVAVVALVLVALPGVIVIARPGRLADLLDPHPLSITLRNGDTTYRVGGAMPTPGDTLAVTIDGDVAFTGDERAVARLGDGAVLDIARRHAGETRRLRMTGAAGGAARSYTIDGVAKPFDAATQAWLAERIPEIYRLSGFDAEARAARLLSAGGVPRLLAEIEKIDADGVRAEYLARFFVQADPDATQIAQALALLRAIGSDYDKRRALDAALARPGLTPDQQVSLLSIAAEMGSDYDRAEWLIAATAKLPFDGPVAAAWSRALQGIGSDYDRQRTLQAAMTRGTPRPQAVALAVEAMRGIGSDYDRRSALQAATASGVALPDAAVMEVIDAIGSDYEKREALLALVDASAPDLARSRAILRSASGIGSDYERGQVLGALAAAMPDDPRLIDDYRAVARTMDDHERGQAEKALDRFARR